MNVAFLSSGSNLGDRLAHLQQIIHKLEERQIHILAQSSVYETAPWGVSEEQPSYFNQVLKISTSLYPFGLMNALKSIEAEMGRTQKGDYQPRTADIDIILFNDWQLHSSTLTLPHDKFRERLFVLEPLKELAPQETDPVTRMTIEELFNQCTDLNAVKICQ